MGNGKDGRRSRRISIECKHQMDGPPEAVEKLAAYFGKLQGLAAFGATKVVLTHPDRDHEWLTGSFILEGDVRQLRPHRSGDLDVDIAVYLDDAVVMRAPHHGASAGHCLPPPAGELILSYLCQPEQLEAVLGDLEQNFQKHLTRHGPSAARRWYWWQVARSAGAFGIRVLQSVALIHELLRKLGL